MKNQIKLWILPFVVFLFSINQSIVLAQKVTDSNYAFIQNERLGRGINILSADPIWRDPLKARMNSNHFRLIKEAGFGNVRIAINPFGFALNQTDFTIDPTFFITLDWAIQQALNNKLMAIIDFHAHIAMQENPLKKKVMFLAMWKQIGDRYKGYSSDVLFEICNEPNMDPAIWNEIHSDAYAILRKSNPNRTLILGTINGNQILHLKDLILPENDKNIIVAIHYYSPIQFTHQGAPWSKKNKDLSGISWANTKKAEDVIKKDFDLADAWSKINKLPITLGEFGAYEKADESSRIRWTDHVARQAEARKWSWSYWQFDSDFIVYDINKEEWVLPILGALIPKQYKPSR